MADARIEELKTLLPQCLLPDWVRLGRRLARLLRDRHHPDQRDALLERLRQQAHASVALREERRLNVPTTTYPSELPITARKDEIVAAISPGAKKRDTAGRVADRVHQQFCVLTRFHRRLHHAGLTQWRGENAEFQNDA